MKKSIAIILIIIMTFLCMNVFGEEKMTVTGMKGPTGMGMVWLDNEDHAEQWKVEYVASAEEAKTAFVFLIHAFCSSRRTIPLFGTVTV